MQRQSYSTSRDDLFRAPPPPMGASGRLEEAAPGRCWRHYKEHWLASLNSTAEGDRRDP